MSADALTDRWGHNSFQAVAYDWCVQNPVIAPLAAWLLWGLDVRRFWRHVAQLENAPAGACILDVPCGGGIAFGHLAGGPERKYAAADISTTMLERAERKAARLGVRGIEFVHADIAKLPFPDASYDLCLTYNGLHCFPYPVAAVGELARVLRSGGSIRGSAVLRDSGYRQDRFVRFMQRTGQFGPTGTVSDLRQWLESAGFIEIAIDSSSAVALFSAIRS